MLVARIAEQLASQVVLVDGRRHAPDPELPCGEHHVLGRLPEVEHDRQWVVRRVRPRRDEGDADGRPREMAGPRTELGQPTEVLAVATDDERPALLVLAAPGATAGVQDALEVGLLERPLGEAADGSPAVDRGPDGIGHDPVVDAVSAGSSGSGRGGRVAPGSATWASVLNPPGVDVTASNCISASGMREASVISARSAARSGSNGPPIARLRNAATARR